MEDMKLTEEQRLYLRYILDYWRQTNTWPTHQYLDDIFYEKHSNLDVEKIGKSLSFQYTNQPDFHRAESEAILTVPAIYLLDKNAPELTTFLKMLKICVMKYRPSSEEWINSKDILGTSLTWDESVDRAEYLLRSEPHIWQSSSGPDADGNWGGKLDRFVRRFRHITTIEEYLENRNPFPQIESAPSIPEPENIDIYIQAHSIIHPDICERSWVQYELEDYDNAIFHATRALEVAIRKKANLPDGTVGAELMNKALTINKGKIPILRYRTEEAEQEGMMSLLRGIIQVYKNPQSHRIVGIEDQSVCLGVILMCSNLLFTIESFEKGKPDEPTQ